MDGKHTYHRQALLRDMSFPVAKTLMAQGKRTSLQRGKEYRCKGGQWSKEVRQSKSEKGEFAFSSVRIKKLEVLYGKQEFHKKNEKN